MLPCRIWLRVIIQSIEVGDEIHLVAQTLSAAEFKASRPQGYGDVRLSRHPWGSLHTACLTQTHRLPGWTMDPKALPLNHQAFSATVASFFPSSLLVGKRNLVLLFSKGSATPF